MGYEIGIVNVSVNMQRVKMMNRGKLVEVPLNPRNPEMEQRCCILERIWFVYRIKYQ